MSHARATELSDLPEVDELECDRPASAGGSDRLSTGARNRERDGGLRESTVERTQTVTSSSVHQEKPPTEGYKYRAEYSTFLTPVPLQVDGILTVETAQVVNTNENSLSDRDFVSATTKQANNDVESGGFSGPQLHENYNTEALKVEDVRLSDLDRPADESATRPATLSAEISKVDDVTATANATDKLSTAAPENYVVTYESDNIVVLDREPVVDCLTPDDDVVNTRVHQLVTAASGEAGLSLPLSESGYDTWKSSQGSVAVAAAACVVASDVGAAAEQRRTPLDDGTLRVCSSLEAFDAHFDVELSSDKNEQYTHRSETCQPGGGESSALFCLENWR